MQRFSEYVRFPYFFGRAVEIRHQRHHQLFRLLLRAYYRRDFRLYLRLHQVYRRSSRPQTYAVLAALFDYLRLFQCKVCHRRHHYAVARALRFLQRARQPRIFLAYTHQLGYFRYQLAFVLQRYARRFADYLDE